MYRLIKTCIICGRGISTLRLVALSRTRRCIHCAIQKGTDIKMPRVATGMDKEIYRDLFGAIRS